MSTKVYTPAEREEFVKTAEQHGIPKSMDMLGYPGSWNTAKKWCDAADVDIPLDALAKHARSFATFYSNQEKVLAAQTLLAQIYETLRRDGNNLQAKDLRELANAMQTVMQTLALVDGTPTNRTESVVADKTDIELQELLRNARAANDTIMQETKD